jgi:predicted ATP-grasp superfamily ATP-dependent carboligase
LARAGFAVGGAASSAPAAGHWSRFCAERYQLPDPRRDVEAYARALAHIAGRDFDVLLPGTDASLIAISRHRDRLVSVRHGLPPADVVERAMDKVALVAIAEESGLGPPESTVCLNNAETRRALDELGLPAVVKPRATCVRRGRGLVQQRGVVVRNREAIDAVAASIDPPVVVQRYLPRASILSCSGVVARGSIRALTAAAYVRTWPGDVGAASYARTVDLPATLCDRVERFLSTMAWDGIFELELLRDGDAFRAIDFNPRIHGWLALAVGSGADLPSIWCRTLLDGPSSAAPSIGRPGVNYRWEDGEVANAVASLVRGRLRVSYEIVRPRRNTVHAMTTWNDPLPLVARIAWIAMRLPRWLLKRWQRPRST